MARKLNEIPDAVETQEVNQNADLLEMIEKLKAENEALKSTKEVAPVEAKPSQEDIDAWMDERVQIQLFKDDKQYKDDLPVSVNGDTILIQRGHPVWIKRKHAIVIENQNRQELVAIRKAEELEGYRKL